MLHKEFMNVYTKFKLHFYQRVFERLNDTFCMEIIYALNNPTVAEFSKIANLSSPNAAYKINNLVKKGYLRKVQSDEDKREYHLEVTEKYMSYYNISYNYMETVMKRIDDRFSKKELKVLEEFFNIIDKELMPEIDVEIKH